MPANPVEQIASKSLKIMVFLHGTAIMHSSGLGRTREQRVLQSMEREPSVRDYERYVPIGSAVEKLWAWQRQGAQIIYLSSHKREEDVDKDKMVLARCGFPPGPVFYRRDGQDYADVVEEALPDVLVEDDCESIGGESKMACSHLNPDLKAKVTSVVVAEFGGLDHLPDDPQQLMERKQTLIKSNLEENDV